MAFALVVEHFDLGLALLSRRLGVPPPPVYRVVKETAEGRGARLTTRRTTRRALLAHGGGGGGAAGSASASSLTFPFSSLSSSPMSTPTSSSPASPSWSWPAAAAAWLAGLVNGLNTHDERLHAWAEQRLLAEGFAAGLVAPAAARARDGGAVAAYRYACKAAQRGPWAGRSNVGGDAAGGSKGLRDVSHGYYVAAECHRPSDP